MQNMILNIRNKSGFATFSFAYLSLRIKLGNLKSISAYSLLYKNEGFLFTGYPHFIS